MFDSSDDWVCPNVTDSDTMHLPLGKEFRMKIAPCEPSEFDVYAGDTECSGKTSTVIRMNFKLVSTNFDPDAYWLDKKLQLYQDYIEAVIGEAQSRKSYAA